MHDPSEFYKAGRVTWPLRLAFRTLLAMCWSLPESIASCQEYLLECDETRAH